MTWTAAATLSTLAGGLGELCRAARGRRGAGATFAQQSSDSGAPCTRQSQWVDRPGPLRNDLFPVFPVKNDPFPFKVGTLFINFHQW